MGASIAGGTLEISPYHEIDGVTSNGETSDIMDGTEHHFIFKYQNGLSDANISDQLKVDILGDFAGTVKANLAHPSGTLIEGSFVKTWITNGTELKGHFDVSGNRFILEAV